MKLKKTFFYAFLTVFFFSCIVPEKKYKDLSFNLKGSFKECAGDTVFLKLIKETGLEFIDSALVDKDGEFTLKGRISSRDFYVLHFNNSEKTITLIPDTCENIVIKSDSVNYDKYYTVENSSESEKVCQIVKELSKMQEVTDTLGRAFRRSVSNKNLAEIKTRLDSVYAVNYKSLREKSEKFLSDNPTLLSQIVCLSQYITPKTPLFDPEKDFSVYKKVHENLSKYYPDNYHTKKLGVYIERHRLSMSGEKPLKGNITEGMTAPEIALPNIKGDTLRLSKLKGKYILVDFRASWSEVSQKRSEKIAALYKKYRSNKFTVFQVALENRHDKWQRALYTQKITWSSVSDLKVWNSKAAQDYGVKTLPASFLIYPDFTIHEINYPIEKLDVKLSELVGQQKKIVKQEK